MEYKMLGTSYLVGNVIFEVKPDSYDKFGAIITRIGESESVEEAKEKCEEFCNFYNVYSLRELSNFEKSYKERIERIIKSTEPVNEYDKLHKDIVLSIIDIKEPTQQYDSSESYHNGYFDGLRTAVAIVNELFYPYIHEDDEAKLIESVKQKMEG